MKTVATPARDGPSLVDRSRPSFLVDVMSPWQKLQLAGLLSIWAIAEVFFWNYWLRNEHVVTATGFALNTILILWFAVLPAYFLFFLTRMQKPNPALQIPPDLKVAMVVTKAQSEPLPVVQKTLRAMLAQTYPHDTWLADEDPNEETLLWCRDHHVFVSTRRGVPAYHQPNWPRRTHTKEGNLAYFYETYGYLRYEFVSQLDCDHVPAPGYLEEMLRPFADPRVGYVSAPSICDANASKNWAARARLRAEATLHGAMQAGYNSGWAPLCIGSHYAVRTRALREIGGLGPELAEDHSTTLMMNSTGWRGVHAFDAEAHGDGPITFEDCMTQEFQWSRSLTTLLLTLFPKKVGGLRFHVKLQFFFSEAWYPLLGIAMLAGYSLPIVALLLKQPLVSVNYVMFSLHTAPLTIILIVMVSWVRIHRWVRPIGSRVLSWEVALFQLSRWPWILAGCLAAVLASLTGRQLNFKVTPKARTDTGRVPMRLLVPNFCLSTLSALALIILSDVGSATGYYWLTLVNGLMYFVVSVALLFLHWREGARE